MKHCGWLLPVVLSAGTLAAASPPGMVFPDDGAYALPSGDQVLYSQLDDPSGYALVDQTFEVAYAAYDAEPADDFVLQLNPCDYDLVGLATEGAQSISFVEPASVNITFYADAGGLPGAVLCDSPGNTNFFSNDFGDLEIELDCTISGTEPVYWISQQVRQDFLSTASVHFWSTRASAVGTPAVWRNPGDGFGTGCTDWQPANAACGATGKDMLFELSGSERDNCPCAPEGCFPVPAVGPLGLLAMVLALGAGGAWMLRVRRGR